MALRRIPVENLADEKHELVVLEGNDDDRLPSNRVYVNPETGKVVDGSKGGSLSQLQGRVIELPKTMWFVTEIDRLKKEAIEMHEIFKNRFQLYEDTNQTTGTWSRLMWVGFDPRGRHEICARYSELHPYEQITIRVKPDIKTHHKIGDDICYMEDHEWSPDWTAATAIGTAIRFLTDYYNGRI